MAKAKKKATFRQMMKKKKEDLIKRTQEAHERKDDSGTSFGSVFDQKKIPEGVEFWRPGKGDHIIDIIPFVAGSNHPNDPKGELSYVVDHWVHRGVGPMREHYMCPSKNFKDPCPICEFIAKERLPEPEWRKVKADHRVAYLVWVHDEKGEEEEKGVQIFEVAHWFFEKNIDEIAKKKRGGGYVVFSDPDEGKSVSFSIKSEGQYTDPTSGEKRESIGFTGFVFEDRDEAVPDEILDQSFSLDECMKPSPSYEEIDEAFNGKKKEGENDKPDDDDESSGSSDDDDPDDDPDIEEEEEEEEDPEEEEEEDPEEEEEEEYEEEESEDDPEEEEEEEEEEEDPEEEEEEDPEEEEEEEEKPKDKKKAKKKAKAKGKSKCPGGGTFGADIDTLSECEECDIWDDCSDEADRLAGE